MADPQHLTFQVCSWKRDDRVVIVCESKIPVLLAEGKNLEKL